MLGGLIRINANNIQELPGTLSGMALTGIPTVTVFDLTAGTNWNIIVQPNGWFEALLRVSIGTNNWEITAKTEAREKIATALIRGTQEFYLAPGDEIELLYFVSRVPSTGDYTIRIGDKLRIEFLGETDSGRTVEVRPDGKISLPLIGAAQAAGQSADGLARQLEQRYRGIVEGAKITVNVTESHSPLQEFLGAFGTSQGRSLTLKLLPDGTISVPARRHGASPRADAEGSRKRDKRGLQGAQSERIR